MPNPIHGCSAIHSPTAIGALTADDDTSQPRAAHPISGPSSPALNDARQALPMSVCIASRIGDKARRGAILKNWANSPTPRTEQTYRELLDAARSLKEPSQSHLWKQSLARIILHIPYSTEPGHFLSVRGQHSAGDKANLTMVQTDEVVATLAASKDGTRLPSELIKDIGRLVTGYLQWRREQSSAMEPIGVSCCMQLLKGLHRDCYDPKSTNADHSHHEYLAEIVLNKSAALSESAKLTQQSPLRTLFMYKLMEHIDPGLRDSLEIDSEFMHGQPEVCALLAAAQQGHLEVIRALTQDGDKGDEFQRPLLSLLQHDPKWAADHWHCLEEMDGAQLIGLLPMLQFDPTWTADQLPQLKVQLTRSMEPLKYGVSPRKTATTWRSTRIFP